MEDAVVHRRPWNLVVTTCLTRVAALVAGRSPLFFVFDRAVYISKAEEDLNYPGGHVGHLG